MNPTKAIANRILDQAKSGLPLTAEQITNALKVTGDCRAPREKRGARYSPADDETLRALANAHTLMQVAIILGRTWQSVESRYRSLGIKRARIREPREDWNPALDAQLIALQLNELQAFCDVLGVSVFGAKARLRLLQRQRQKVEAPAEPTEDVCLMPPVQRWVRAVDAKPLQVRAPRSVFEVAA